MYYVLSTLLYYYLSKIYGDISHDGIRTLDDTIEESEYIDPVDALEEIDLSQIPPSLSRLNPAFSIVNDGGMTISNAPMVRDVIIPEKELLKFTSSNDASPVTFIAVLAARAIDKINPERKKDIFLSIHQNFEEDIYYKALLNELADNGIPYMERAALINDVAKFEEPMD